MELLNYIYRYINSDSNFAARNFKKFLCFRTQYEKIDFDTPSDIPDISWLIKGNTLEAYIWNTGTFIDAKCDSYLYQVNSEWVIAKSHAQKVKVADYFCCGCQFPEDEFTFDEPCETTTRSLTEGETAFSALLKLFLEIGARDKIGSLTFKIHSSLDEENGLGFTRNMVWNHLEDAKLDVPLLVLKTMGFKQLDVTPFVELFQFKHLIIMTYEPLMITEKILKSELLFLDVPILNMEKLDNFNGFALLLGKMRINNFSLDLLCEQIEKYLEDTPSKLEFFALYDPDQWITGEMVDRLKEYSIQNDDDFPKPHCSAGETILRLDKEDNAAILIRAGQNVVFVRNGWRKWHGLLEGLYLTF